MQRRRLVGYLVTLVGVLAVAQVANVGYRSIQVLLEIGNVEPKRFCSPAYMFVRDGIGYYSDPKLGVDIALSDTNDPALTAADGDGDGLHVAEEIVRLTSDALTDSDGDSFPDPIDSSPNCASTTYEGEVITSVVRSLLPDITKIVEDQPVYALTSNTDHCYGAPDDEGTIVTMDAGTYYLVSGDLGPNILDLEKVIFVPGGLHVYGSSFDCGKLCGEYRHVIVFDFPIWGPVVVGTFHHEVS